MVKLIVAKALNNAIGKDNDLIWHLPADMRFFTEMTTGHVVIMGRRNWDSIPLKYRPLSNRVNAVVTRNEDFDHPDCLIFPSVELALQYFDSKDDKDVYIIGGGQIYKYCLDHELVDEMYITEIDATFEADTFFPEFKEQNWNKELIMTHEIDEKNNHRFKIYHYKRKK